MVAKALPHVEMADVGDLMQEESPGWFDWRLRVIESPVMIVWFMRRRFRGLNARRWVEDWIRGHYPDEDVQIFDCDVRSGGATILRGDGWGACDGWRAGVCGGCGHNLTDR